MYKLSSKGLNMLWQIKDTSGRDFGCFDYPVPPQVGGRVRFPDPESGELHNLPVVDIEVSPTDADTPPIATVRSY
jgi:hypothetical protein